MSLAHGELRVRQGVDWLDAALRLYPDLPSLALFRAAEMRALEGFTLARPLLDLGGGDGELSALLFGEPCDLSLDLSERDLARGTARHSLRHPLVGDARRLPLRSQSVGGILANSVLEHIDGHRSVLSEAARVLRPGGRFLFTVPSERFNDLLLNPKRLRAAGREQDARRYIEMSDRSHAHLYYQDQAAWQRELEAAGLRLLASQSYLPEPAMEMWDRLEYLLTRPFYEAIPHWNARLLALCPPRWARPIWWLALRKSFRADCAPGSVGGCQLYYAERPAEPPG